MDTTLNSELVREQQTLFAQDPPKLELKRIVTRFFESFDEYGRHCSKNYDVCLEKLSIGVTIHNYTRQIKFEFHRDGRRG